MNLNPPPEGEAPGRPEAQETLTLAAAAARLRLPESTLITALQRGLVSGFQGPDGDWRVVLDEAPAAGGGGTPPGQSAAPPSGDGEPLASDDAVARLGAAIDSLKQDFSRLDPGRPAVTERPFGADLTSPEPSPAAEPGEAVAEPEEAVAEPEPAEPEAAPEAVETRQHLGSEIAELSGSIRRLLAAEEEPVPPAADETKRDDEVAYLRLEVMRRDEIIEAKDKLIAELARRVARTSERLTEMLPGQATILAQVESVRARFQATTTERDRELEVVRDLLQALHAVLAERHDRD